MNSQNSRIWATENPHDIHESPLHSKKVGVWRTISGQRIIGPIFFRENLNTTAYLNIFTMFVEQLNHQQLTQGYFQQDGATRHTSNVAISMINNFFPDHLISKNLWPP